MKEVFEHEGNKYVLIEGQGGKGPKSCIGCAFKESLENTNCKRWDGNSYKYKIFEEHECIDRTDIFTLIPILGPKKKLEL